MFVENNRAEQRVRVRQLLNRLIAGKGRRIRVVGGVETPDGLVVVVATPRGRPMCPCGSRGAVYDQRVRRWRHLDAGTARVWLQAPVRRVNCPACGRVRTEQVPWARPGARHTSAFEDKVAWLVQRCDKTTVAQLMRISWRTVGAIAGRVVADHLSLDRLDGLRRIGVDEVSYRKGHRYLTVVVDHDTGRVVWIAEGRGKRSLHEFFDALGQERAAELEAISMDMGPTYRKVAAERAPTAAICLDPFHVAMWAGEALDRVYAAVTRGREKLALPGRGRSGRRVLLRRGREKLTHGQRALIDQLREARWELFRAWELKERLRDIYRIPAPDARAHFLAWLQEAGSCGITQIEALAERLAVHTEGILAAIELGLSNSRVESLNGRIRLIHRRGYGYHTAAAMAALIYLCCSQLPIQLPT